MFRRSNGRLSFSLSRFATNAVPNFANDSNIYELSLAEKDALFKSQLAEADPTKLNCRAFAVGGIVANSTQSPNVHASLTKHGILSPDDGSLHTSRITKHLPNQLPILSIHAMRKLVFLLFFWEEEVLRFQLLDLQEREAREGIAVAVAWGGRGRHEDHVALEGVRRRRVLMPSQRDVDVGRRKSVPPPYVR